VKIPAGPAPTMMQSYITSTPYITLFVQINAYKVYARFKQAFFHISIGGYLKAFHF
jgi:hypothetical protein